MSRFRQLSQAKMGGVRMYGLPSQEGDRAGNISYTLHGM